MCFKPVCPFTIDIFCKFDQMFHFLCKASVSLVPMSLTKEYLGGSPFESGKSVGKDIVARYSILNSFKGVLPIFQGCVVFHLIIFQ